MDTLTTHRLILFGVIVSFAVQVGARPLEIQQEWLNINTASFEELQRIMLIGPERARQIFQLRQQRRFGSVDEIVRVRGIAAARLPHIKDQGLACVRN